MHMLKIAILSNMGPNISVYAFLIKNVRYLIDNTGPNPPLIIQGSKLIMISTAGVTLNFFKGNTWINFLKKIAKMISCD